MARVSYSVGFTRNMGDFESLRIDVGVSDDPIGEENTSQAYNRLKDFVESRLMDDLVEVEKAIRDMRAQIRETGEYKRKVKNAAEKAE